ncbi:hypothetical protein GUV66_14025 [Stenotrophomonas maltophilia]|nr:hypothetical protein [Stenotrophomonas maltophilia]MCF3558727.1 hypothetical protein [Stenotrophomonas maltophilia]MCF3564393.1 hypothetical protein [Stenotrophomonas maltophilia]
MTNPRRLYEPQELAAWFCPYEGDLEERVRDSFRRAKAALTAVLTGEMLLTPAAAAHRLCPKRLRRMVKAAPQMHADGMANGFRVCVPWGTYSLDYRPDDSVGPPRSAGPRALRKLLSAIPAIREWVDGFDRPLPPGRAPRAFDRLHKKICTELRRRDLADHYPLNTVDRGRRALLEYVRRQRIASVIPGTLELSQFSASSLDDTFKGRLFDRTEFDAHKIDIEAVVGVETPGGGRVDKKITTIWLLIEVETCSRAIMSWSLRVGRGYTNLDVASCLAMGLRPWVPRQLTIPDLCYVPGAGMPSGLEPGLANRRSRSIALDNALAHSADDLEAPFCRSRGGVLIFGRAHEPRSRPIVEQLFSRLERGALRHIPGGFEPAKRLGASKLRISTVSAQQHVFHLAAFEELIDVIVANYNATPHVALGTLSPLQFLQKRSRAAFEFGPDTDEQDALELCTVVVPLIVHGNRSTGVVPHVNYKYVRYRGAGLDERWELIGKTVMARVNRNDLRTLMLMRGPTAPLCLVRAAAPWDRTAHDEVTRKMIMQWSKNRSGLSVAGSDCAVQAYVAFLRSAAGKSQVAADQLARLASTTPAPTRSAVDLDYFSTPLHVPSSGWVSLDE